MRVDPRLRMADDVAALIRDAVRSMPGLPGPFMTSIFAEPLAVEIRDGDLWVRPATGDEVAELLTCLLADKAQSDPGVFRSRAMALVGAIAPVLVWLRDHKGVPLNINTMQVSTDLRSIWKLAMEKIALLRDPIDGTETQIDVSGGIPEDLIWPLRSYLGELPGYDPELPLDKQKSREARKQHSYVISELTDPFIKLAVLPRTQPRGYVDTRSFRMVFCDRRFPGCGWIERANPSGSRRHVG